MRFSPLPSPSSTPSKTVALIIFLAAILIMYPSPCLGDSPAVNVPIEWVFNKTNGMQGWTANGHLKDVAVTDEGLSATAVDHDPILQSPVFKIPLRPTQTIEIRMKSTVPSSAQLFWATDLKGTYGGFSEAKVLSFPTKGDETVHTYRLRPYWHVGEELVRLRFDPPAAGSFTLLSIRVVEPAGEMHISSRTAWDFADGLDGWTPDDGCGGTKIENGRLTFTATGAQAAITSPLVSIDAASHFFVSFRMATTAGTTGSVFAVAKDKPGRDAVSFRVIPDGKMHTYNVDVGGLDNWKGEILLVGIQPSDEPGADVSFESIAVSAKPAGPVDLRCRYFGRLDTVSRVERPTTVTCLIENSGGTEASDVVLKLNAPAGVTVLDKNPKTIPAVRLGIPRDVTWRVAAKTPGEYHVGVDVQCGGKTLLSETTTLKFTKTPDVPKTDYLPEPRPVKSTPEIGVFYFPGWGRHGPLAADSRLSRAEAGPRVVRRSESGMRRLADQMGGRARGGLLYGRLVLGPRRAAFGTLGPRRVREREVPQVSQMVRYVGES